MKKAFVDTNVILDYLLDRDGADFSQQLLERATRKELFIGFSFLSVANTAYVLRHKHTRESVNRIIADLCDCMHILSMDEFQLSKALANPIRDFEDNLQYQCAKAHGFTTIITRNIKDFPFSDINVITPKEAIGFD